jgi:hypothetical protein
MMVRFRQRSFLKDVLILHIEVPSSDSKLGNFIETHLARVQKFLVENVQSVSVWA